MRKKTKIFLSGGVGFYGWSFFGWMCGGRNYLLVIAYLQRRCLQFNRFPENIANGAGYTGYVFKTTLFVHYSGVRKYIAPTPTPTTTPTPGPGIEFPMTQDFQPIPFSQGNVTKVANWLLGIIGIWALIGFVDCRRAYFLVATDEKMVGTAKENRASFGNRN